MALACEQIRNEFSALLDDELNSEDRELVEEHLFECADCLRELHGFKQVSDAYRFTHPAKAPDDFEALLRDALNPAGAGRSYLRSTWLLAAAAAVLVTFSLFLWRGPDDDRGGFRMSMHSDEAVLDGVQGEALSQEAAPAMEGGRRSVDEIRAGSVESAASEPSTFVADAALRDDAAPEPPAMESLALPAPAPASPPEAPRREAAETPVAESMEDANAESAAGGAFGADGVAEDLGESRMAARSLAFKAEAEKPMAAAPPPPAEPMAVTWRDRPFSLVEGVLQQDNYAGEAVTLVARPSEEWTGLLDEFPDLTELVDGAHPVIVQIDETWYRIDVQGASGQ